MHATRYLLSAICCQCIFAFAYGLVDETVGANTEKHALDQSFEVYEVHSGHYTSAIARVVSDYLRQNVDPPPELVAAAKRQSGSVKSAPQPFDFSYLTPVIVHNQTFMMKLDTGSSDLWIFSKQLPKHQQGTHSIYQETGNRMHAQGGEFWNISYLDGTGASGTVWRDRVTVAGVTARSQAVEAASRVSESFTDGPADGVFGLAFESLNSCFPRKCRTFMSEVLSTLKAPVLTATLRKGRPGTYDFGSINRRRYTGKLEYVPAANRSGLWGFHPKGYSIGSGEPMPSRYFTTADTGTSLNYLPADIAAAYYSEIDGARFNKTLNLYLYPCKSKIPSFNLYIGSHKAVIPSSYAEIGIYEGETCIASIQSSEQFPNSILGTAFLKSQFVVFDYLVPRLGFAHQKGVPKS